MKKLSKEEARGKAAQAWTTTKNSHKEMDSDLAESFSDILVESCGDVYKDCETLYEAVFYVLNRAQTDPEFRWHMLDTEAFSKLIEAEAAFSGRDPKEVRAARERDLQPVHRRRDAECSLNRERVHEYRRLLEENGINVRGSK